MNKVDKLNTSTWYWYETRWECKFCGQEVQASPKYVPAISYHSIVCPVRLYNLIGPMVQAIRVEALKEAESLVYHHICGAKCDCRGEIMSEIRERWKRIE
jgi:hypothetical protein